MSSAGVLELENGPDHRRTAPKMRGLALVLLSFQTLGRFYFFFPLTQRVDASRRNNLL